MGGLGEIWIEAGRLIRGEVPWFVKAFGSRADGPVPVFIYHTIDPVVFEAHLLFLAENGYETWDADTYLEYLSGRTTKDNPRAVVLTIDDARLSVWTHGYPLLKKYGARAVVFVIPGLTPDAPPRELSGKSRGDGDDEIVNWSEIRIMHKSGHVDVQSHSLYHVQVPRSPKVVSLLDSFETVRAFDSVPAPVGFEDLPIRAHREDLLGFPVFDGSSLFLGGERFVPPEEFIEACVKGWRRDEDRAHGEGVESFLRRIAWPPERIAGEGRYALVEPEIEHSLRRSRHIIEERLPGKAVRHFCFPYGLFCAASIAEVKRAGYNSAFLSYVRGQDENRPGGDPFSIVRLKNDYLPRLPGRGRRSLWAILGMKLARRLRGETGY